MAMSAVCQMSLALLAMAFARSDDWDGVARRDTDKFYQGPVNGEFGHYLEHGGDFSKFADHFSQDRLNEAKKDAETLSKDSVDQAKEAARWFTQHDMDPTSEALLRQAKGDDMTAGSFAVALAAAPAQEKEDGAKTSGDKHTAEDHQQAEHEADDGRQAEDHQQAQHHAEAIIGELREWDAKLESDLKDKDFPARVANSIVSKAKAGTVHQRNQLEGAFDSALNSISHATNSTEASRAEHAARESAKDLLHLDHQERKAMRETLHSIEKQGKRKARALWKTARKAVHQAYRQGMTAARAQRKAGVAEHIYEGAMGNAERVSEGLSGRAEHAAERAEHLLERQSGIVEHELEGTMDKLEGEAQRQHRQYLQEVSERAHKVKRAHEADHAADHDPGAKAKPEAAKKQDGHTSTFLASSEPMGLSISAVACCALATGLMATLLVLHFRREGSNMASPLLS